MPKTARTAASDVKSIAERLTQAVEACRPPLTRTQLAKKLRVTPGAVSHYLNGNRPCPDEVVVKIARITKVEPGWLMRGTSTNGKSGGSLAATPAPRRARTRALAWGFREAPADGGKDFGNAAVYATP